MRRLGLHDMPPFAFLCAAGLWLVLTLLLVLGLIKIVFDVIWYPIDDSVAAQSDSAFRFLVAQLVALTAVLGAAISLPITLTRLRLARDTLFNQKITEAAADLYAQRQVTRWAENDKAENGWEDDIVRRNAAIDRLEGLVRENPPEADRVAHLLSTYVREMSHQYRPEPLPEDLQWRPRLSGKDLQNWRSKVKSWWRTLSPKRTDMENAVKVLGRLTHVAGLKMNTLPIDLRDANLQGMKFKGLDFRKSALSGAQMQGVVLIDVNLCGADLSKAQMQGAFFSECLMQGAHFIETRLQCAQLQTPKMQAANLFLAELQGAVFGEAQMQGANLEDAQLQGARLPGAELQRAIFLRAALMETDLAAANLQRSILRVAQMKGAWLIGAQLQMADLRSVILEEETNLEGADLTAAAASADSDNPIILLKRFWPQIFADGSVRVPLEHPDRPAHWPAGSLEPSEFEKAWHAWAKSHGHDPDDPTTH